MLRFTTKTGRRPYWMNTVARDATTNGGHVLQSRQYGFIYLKIVGLPSLMSTALPFTRKVDGDHSDQPFEQDANIRALNYFVKYEEDFQINDWDFGNLNPINGYRRTEAWDSEHNRSIMSQNLLKSHWIDYTMIWWLSLL